MTIRTSSFGTGPPAHPSAKTPGPSEPRDEILALIPSLRAYAMLLVGNPGRADDLVETTLRTTWTAFPPVVPPPGLKVRLFTILRHAAHALLSQSSRSRGRSGTEPSASFRDSLAALPIHQRDALLLLVGEGFSTQDTSTICGCSAGTTIRRAERGRRKLAQSTVLDQHVNVY